MVTEPAGHVRRGLACVGHREIAAMMRADGHQVSTSTVLRALRRRDLVLPQGLPADRKSWAILSQEGVPRPAGGAEPRVADRFQRVRDQHGRDLVDLRRQTLVTGPIGRGSRHPPMQTPRDGEALGPVDRQAAAA